MSAAATPAAPTPIDAMTFEQLQADLKAIPERRERAIRDADVAAVRTLRDREVDLKVAIAKIRVANLTQEVDKREREVQDTMAAEVVANRASVEGIERARRKVAEGLALQREGEREHAAAIAQQEHARFNLDAARKRLAEASTLRTAAMRELDADLRGVAP